MTDRDELAKQMFLARNGGGAWLGEYDDHWDFTNAIEEADAVLPWITERLAKARADALEEAVAALIMAAPPLNAELSMHGGDGPHTGPGMSAYVEGFHDAHSAVRALSQDPALSGLTETLPKPSAT